MKTKHLIFLLLPVLVLLWNTSVIQPAESVSPSPTLALSAASGYNVELVGHIGGAVRAVFAQGNRVYIGQGPRLVVLDISNPTAPALMGQSAPGSEIVQDVYVAGNYAFVVGREEGLRVIDVSNPAAPAQVGAVALGLHESARRVTVAGNYAYVSIYSGFLIIDVSNPAAPTLRGRYSAGAGPVGGLAVMGNYVYVPASAYGGAQVVDVSNPKQPFKVTSMVGIGGSPNEVTIIGQYAYVIADSFGSPGGLFVFDISDPAAPLYVRSYSFYGYDHSAVAGSVLYLLGGGGLTAVDMAGPAAPMHLGAYSVNDEACDVAVAGGLAYVAEGRAGLRVVDVSQTMAESGYYYPPAEAKKVVASEQYVYMTTQRSYENRALRIVDVSNPAAPLERGVYQPPASRYIVDIGADGSRVYLIEDENSDRFLRVIDVSNPDAPLELGAIGGDIWNSPDVLAVSGNYAYTVGHYDTFRVIDVSTPTSPTMVATGTLRAYDMAVAGHYAYLAMDYPGGLRVLDIQTPTTPVEIGAYTPANPNSQTRGVVVEGHYAYLDEPGRVAILNVSDPAHPSLVGSYETDGNVAGIAADTLYVATDGIQAVDVSNPAQPTERARSRWFGELAVAGNHAYIAAGWNGLRVLDVSGLALPARSGAYNLPPGDARHVTVAGSHAYVADADGGLKVVEVSNPAAPTALGRLDTAGRALGVAVAGQFGYVADAGNGLVIADLSDPGNPQPLGSLAYQEVSGMYDLRAIAVHSNTAYLAAGWSGFYLVDVSNPITPTEMSLYYMPNTSFFNDVTVSVDTLPGRTHAYLVAAGNTQGLRILDVTHPLSITETGFYDAWPAYDVSLGNARAYVAAGPNGLRIMDVTHPISPTELGDYASNGGSLGNVFVNGRYAYLLEDTGLRVVDISNPQRPIEVGDYRPGMYGGGRPALRGATAYLAASEKGLRVVDLSDPRRPQELGVYQPADTQVIGVAVAGNYAGLYVRLDNSSQELRIVDISDPANIYQTGVYTEHAGIPLAAVGNLLYIQGDQAGTELYILDISNPTAPSLAGFYDAYGIFNKPEDMVIAGNYAYVAFGNYGMHALDISYPSQPSRVGYTTRCTYNLATDGNHLYTIEYAAGKRGLHIYDVTNPAQMSLLGFQETTNPRGVAAAAGYAYVADDGVGLRVIDVADPAVPLEVGTYLSPGYAEGIAAGEQVYVLENGTVRVVNVSDPGAPFEVGLYRLPDPEVASSGVTLAGGYLYVADGAGGLYILRPFGEVHYTHVVYLPIILR